VVLVVRRAAAVSTVDLAGVVVDSAPVWRAAVATSMSATAT
jgi:beta-phosphoglucomutase-like phosphatase (HAD superfamily)